MKNLYEEVQLVLETEQISEAYRRTYKVHDWNEDGIGDDHYKDTEDFVNSGDEHTLRAGQSHMADIVHTHGGELVPDHDHQFMVRWFNPKEANQAEKHMSKIADFSSEEGG